MHATILRISEFITQVEGGIGFAAMFLWLIGFYTLYQRTRQKFILWLIWGELLAIIAVASVFVFSHQLLAAVEAGAKDTYSQGIILLSVARFLGLIAVVVSTIGALLALRYLKVHFRKNGQ